jgi:hypothetical protein
MSIGAFLYFQNGFFVILRFIKGILVFFLVGKLFFYSKTLLGCDVHTLANGCRPRCLGDVCSTIEWLNLLFHRVLRYIVVSSSLWGGVLRWMMVGLLSTVIFFLPSFLSLLEKVHIYPLIFRFVNFNPYIFFIFFFILGSIIKILNVFNLTIKLQFVIYYFSNSILILLNYDFFSLALLLKFCWFSISSFNQSLFVFKLTLQFNFFYTF